MTEPSESPVELARDLIRCPSVTPEDAGALDVLERALARGGFHCRRLTFTEDGTPPIDNLFARIGSGSPHICFAGHADVVPPGDESLWTYPPFAGVVEDGALYGRGAADMKGAIACFAAAALDFAKAKGDDIPGSISLLITGDEEGPAINGTRKVLEWMAGATASSRTMRWSASRPIPPGSARRSRSAGAAASRDASRSPACKATSPIRISPRIR